MLLLLTAAVFMRVVGCGFLIHDDPGYVVDNPHVRTGLSLDNVGWAATSLHGGVSYWHPLTWLSHQLDCALFGLNPAAHHLTNLWLHVANTMLVLALMRRLGLAAGPALFVAALFGVHPLHVESVAWIAERKDVLYGFWWLCAAYGYVRFREPWDHGTKPGRPRLRQRQELRWYGVALGCFVLALLSKPTAVTLPIVLLLVEWLEAGNHESDESHEWDDTEARPAAVCRVIPRVPWLARLLPFLVLSAVSCGVTIAGQRGLGALPSLAVLPLSDRLDNALVSYVIYLEKTVVPSGLCVSYVQSAPYAPATVLGAAAALVAISVAAFRARRVQPWILAGWLWFVLTLIPNIGLVQAGAQSRADRYMYIPLIGVGLLIAAAVEALARRFRSESISAYSAVSLAVSRLIRVGGLAAILVCSALSVRQLSYWRDSVTLFSRAVDMDGQNWVAHLGLGMALTQQRRFDEALPHLRKASELSGHAAEVEKRLAPIEALYGGASR